MIDNFVLTNLLVSKIIHDAIGKVSVVSQALEMLDLPIEASAKADYQDLIRESTKGLAVSLPFMRFVYGSQGLSEGQADIPVIQKLVNDQIGQHKANLSWSLEQRHVSYSHLRALAAMVVVAADALPWGGEIVAASRRMADGRLMFEVTGKADRVQLREDLAEALEKREPASGWQAKNIHPCFVHVLAERFGVVLNHESTGQSIRLTMAGIPALA